MIGLILGSGANLSKKFGSLEGPSFRVYGPASDRSFLMHIYSIFCFLCRGGIVETSSTGTLKSGSIMSYPQLLFYTMQLYDLEYLYNMMYRNGNKIIPLDIST